MGISHKCHRTIRDLLHQHNIFRLTRVAWVSESFFLMWNTIPLDGEAIFCFSTCWLITASFTTRCEGHLLSDAASQSRGSLACCRVPREGHCQTKLGQGLLFPNQQPPQDSGLMRGSLSHLLLPPRVSLSHHRRQEGSAGLYTLRDDAFASPQCLMRPQQEGASLATELQYVLGQVTGTLCALASPSLT